MLEVMDLSYSYENRRALHKVSLQAKCSEIISLIGPNGSGKSTLLRCINGLLRVPSSDSIRLYDRSIRAFSKKELAREIAFLPQFQEKMPGITVRELVLFGRTPHQKTGWVLSRRDREKVDWALEYLQLQNFQHRYLDKLSGGERQRAWIAMALAQDTPLLLLDEPVTYMDLKHQWELLEIIIGLKEAFDKTIISVFHDINHALEVSDTICVMNQGAVHSIGSPKIVITEEAIKQVYGIHVHVCQVEPGWRPVVIPEGRCCQRAERQLKCKGLAASELKPRTRADCCESCDVSV